ncbi:MAG: hypothetical protein ACTSUT_14135 [Promethearchaeota archaeon]
MRDSLEILAKKSEIYNLKGTEYLETYKINPIESPLELYGCIEGCHQCYCFTPCY